MSAGVAIIPLARSGDATDASWRASNAPPMRAVVSSRMTAEQLHPPPALEAEPETSQRNMRICVWCGNRDHQVCMSCQQEGKYRHLEAAPLDPWEQPPELPAMRELVDLPARERLALIWLNIRYWDQREAPGDI